MKKLFICLLACTITGCEGSPLANALAGKPVVDTSVTYPTGTPPSQASTVPNAPTSPAIPAGTEEVPELVAPFAVPTDWKTYEDFDFKFSYPGVWDAKDMSLADFALASKLRLNSGASGKASLFSPVFQLGPPGAALFWGTQGSFGDSYFDGKMAANKLEPVSVKGVVWKRALGQTFNNGQGTYTIVLGASHGTSVYVLGFFSSPGQELNQLQNLADVVLSSWVWK